MTRNEGTADRIVRLVVAVVAVAFGWWAGFASIGGVLLLVFAGWMVLTGVVGVCPGYWLLKTSTYPSPHRTSSPGGKAATQH